MENSPAAWQGNCLYSRNIRPPGSALALPEEGRVGGQFTAAAEVVRFAGDQILRQTALCIKVRGIRLVVDVDRDQNALTVIDALPDALFVGQQYLLEVTVAQNTRSSVRLCKRSNPLGQVVPQRFFKRGTQRVISLVLFTLGAPFATVVDTGMPGMPNSSA